MGLGDCFCESDHFHENWRPMTPEVDTGVDYRKEKQGPLTGFTTAFIAGGLAGIAEWTVSLPLDTIKTRVQSGEGTASSGFYSACINIYESQGARGFYRGIGPVMLRAFPASGAALGGIHIVEQIFRYDRRSSRDKDSKATETDKNGDPANHHDGTASYLPGEL
jgi:hypothetical protein